jgi:hypothetical protein
MSVESNLDLKEHLINKIPCIILHKGKVMDNLLHNDILIARNYIRFKYYNRKFNEPERNKFVCSKYGTTFTIVELKY